jgi:hypothetical protein
MTNVKSRRCQEVCAGGIETMKSADRAINKENVKKGIIVSQSIVPGAKYDSSSNPIKNERCCSRYVGSYRTWLIECNRTIRQRI